MTEATTETVDATPDSLKLIETVGRYKLHRFVAAEKIIEDASLGNVLLNDAVIEQSALAAYYGERFAKSLRQYGMMKMNVDAVEAKVDAELRDRFVEEGKKVTEKAIETAIADDPRVKEARKALIVADEIKNMLFSAMDAMRQRRDSLEMLGRIQNDEHRGALRIMAQDNTRSKAMDIRSRLKSKA